MPTRVKLPPLKITKMMRSWLLPILITIVVSGKMAFAIDEFWLESPRVTNWGPWGSVQRCPTGQYATGFRLKTESSQGRGDDTALNGIELYCNLPGRMTEANPIRSRVGDWGDWGSKYRCLEGLLTGFQLRSEPYIRNDDDTAANNLRMICSNSAYGRMEGDGRGWGDWTSEQKCGSRQAVCGIKTQVETRQGDGDDTSLNNVDMYCCNVPSPASLCKPVDSWDEVITCTNAGSSGPLKCQYSYKTGVGFSSESSSTTTEERAATQSIGFSIGAEIKFLQANFESSFSWSQTTSHSWSSSSTNNWSEEKTVTADFEAPPGRKMVLSQVVGKCGDLKAFTVDFKLTEFDLNGKPVQTKAVSQSDLEQKKV